MRTMKKRRLTRPIANESTMKTTTTTTLNLAAKRNSTTTKCGFAVGISLKVLSVERASDLLSSTYQSIDQSTEEKSDLFPRVSDFDEEKNENRAR